MATKLFHTIIVCGAALAGVPLACASEPLVGEPGPAPGASGEGGEPERADRCRAPDGGCIEHCAPIADGGCLDPCFVHTETCSPDCMTIDGGCGWPPTK